LVCAYVGSAGVAVSLMVVAMGFFGASQSGVACSFLEVAPVYSSTLNTIANVFGSVAGIATPMAVSVLTTLFPKDMLGWRVMFWLTAMQSAVALVMWYRFQTSQVVEKLNSPRPKKTVAYKEWFPWFRYEE
jgi:MFS family permease